MRHNSCTFKLAKPDSYPLLTKKSLNIFQTPQKHIIEKFDPFKDKPIGGINTFFKEQAKRQSKKILKNSQIQVQIKKDTQLSKSIISKDQKSKESEVSKNQQEYKTHQAFRPSTAKVTKSNCFQSQIYKGSKVSKRTVAWADDQIQIYHKKSAMLNQVSYKQPLIQRYGDRYFEYILRQRYKDDLKPSPYIYQIKGKSQIKNKFISTLKKYRPDIANQQKLILQGKSIKIQK